MRFALFKFCRVFFTLFAAVLLCPQGSVGPHGLDGQLMAPAPALIGHQVVIAVTGRNLLLSTGSTAMCLLAIGLSFAAVLSPNNAHSAAVKSVLLSMLAVVIVVLTGADGSTCINRRAYPDLVEFLRFMWLNSCVSWCVCLMYCRNRSHLASWCRGLFAWFASLFSCIRMRDFDAFDVAFAAGPPVYVYESWPAVRWPRAFSRGF